MVVIAAPQRFCPEHQIPERGAHAEGSVGIMIIVNQMARAQILLNRSTRAPEMDAVMNCFIPGETRRYTAEEEDDTW